MCDTSKCRRKCIRNIQKVNFLKWPFIVALTLTLGIVIHSFWINPAQETSDVDIIGMAWQTETKYLRSSARNPVHHFREQYSSQDDQSAALTFTDLFDHKKIRDYCYLPHNSVVGMEGFITEDYTMEQVHVVQSPGAEYPVLPTDLVNTLNTNVQSVCQNTLQNQDLQTFYDAMKSHAKQDLSTLMTQCKDGELLPLGHTQHFKLGSFLKDTYLNSWNLERNSSSKPKHLYARYSGTTVSKSSLYSLLFGMLPSHHFKEVLINKLDQRFCFTNSSSLCKCHEPESMRQKYLDLLNVRFQSFFQTRKAGHMRRIFDYKSGNANFMHMFYYIMFNLCQNNDVFCSLSSCQGIAATDFVNLLMYLDEFIEDLTKTKEWENYSDIYVFMFLYDLMHKFHTAKHVFEKLFIYSVDEPFILHLLTAIRYPIKTLPRPASRVVFELYKKSGQLIKPYYLRVLFNGMDITNSIPLCKSNLQDGLCKMKYFLDYHRIKHKAILSNGMTSVRCSG